MSLCTKKCRSCQYGSHVEARTTCCMYILITGTTRGCTAGDECDRYKKGPQIAVDGRETPDTERKVCYLAKAGHSDYQIARLLKIPQNRIKYFRESAHIPEPLALTPNGEKTPYIGRKHIRQMAEEGLTGKEMAGEYRVGKDRINKLKHNMKGEQTNG